MMMKFLLKVVSNTVTMTCLCTSGLESIRQHQENHFVWEITWVKFILFIIFNRVLLLKHSVAAFWHYLFLLN